MLPQNPRRDLCCSVETVVPMGRTRMGFVRAADSEDRMAPWPPLKASESRNWRSGPTPPHDPAREETGAAGARDGAGAAVNVLDEPTAISTSATRQGDAARSRARSLRPRVLFTTHDPNHAFAPPTALLVRVR